MPTAPVFGRRFVRQVWPLIRVYWTSDDAKWGGLLLALAMAFELATVWGNIMVAQAERRILDALVAREPAAFAAAIGFFFMITTLFVVTAAYRLYMRQSLEIRWRRRVTGSYAERWIGPHASLLAELHRDEVDNPDQRIQEDARDFVASALGLSLSLFAALATLLSFGQLLWTLSAPFPVHLGSLQVRIPGFMLWIAIGYGVVSMWVTHVVGRPLVGINFDRLRVEADFRYGLTRFRDNAVAVALSRGVEVERAATLDRFRYVIQNWWDLIRAQRNLTLLTGGIGQANGVVPVLAATPAYFAGAITLGTIAQIRIAYGQVSGSLAWFVYAYQEIARWRANIERLSTFSDVMDATERTIASGGIHVTPSEGDVLRLRGLRIEEPDGHVLLDGANASVDAGDRVAITGPSGTGKTLLLRAIAGIWPFGGGTIEVPPKARSLFVTQYPYIAVGTLRAATSYPAPEGSFPDNRIVTALRLVGLGRFEHRLGETAHWDQLFSPHEQQRLALVRVLLHAPDWLFLDKATSALDEATEKRAYEILAEQLPRATIVSIAHSPAVAAYHTHRWNFSPAAGRVALEAA